MEDQTPPHTHDPDNEADSEFADRVDSVPARPQPNTVNAQTQAPDSVGGVGSVEVVEPRSMQASAAPAQIDPARASAFAHTVASIYGNDVGSVDRASLINWLTRDAASISDTTSDEAIARIACHVPVLEGLFLRFSKAAVECGNPLASAALAKVALSAQAGALRATALIAELKARQPVPVLPEGHE